MIIRSFIHPLALNCLLLSMLPAGAAHGQSLDGTLKKIRDTGTITIATRGASITPAVYCSTHQATCSESRQVAWPFSLR